MKRWHLLLFALLAICLVSAGCRKKRSSNRNNVRESDGIVEELTGDDDSEVDDDLEDMVYDAVQLGDNDEPLDF